MTMAIGRLFSRFRKEKVTKDFQNQPLDKHANREAISALQGRIKYGFPLSRVIGNACPKCGASLTQCRARVAYTGDEEMGTLDMTDTWMCSACPTLVIDEKAAKLAVKAQGDRLMFLAGIDIGKEDPDYFKTWDEDDEEAAAPKKAKKANELMAMLEMMAGGGMPSGETETPVLSGGVRKQKKSKRKLASKARRRNRRKK
jgi:hypothetical protein